MSATASVSSPPRFVPPIRPSLASLRAHGPSLAFFVDMYARYGTAARIAMPGSSLVVASGQDVNRFVAHHARSHLVVGSFRQQQNAAYGAHHTLVSSDGDHHTMLRTTLQGAYHRSVLATHQTDALAAFDGGLAELPRGVPIGLTALFTPLVCRVLGAILLHHDPEADSEHLSAFLRAVVAQTLANQRVPGDDSAYQQARSVSLAYAETVLATHRCPVAHRPTPDLADVLLAAQQAHPDALPDGDVRAAVLAPFIGGLDTLVCACSFLLVAVLGNPVRYGRVMNELRATNDATPAALPCLTAAMREALRRYPPTPILRATAVQPFTLGDVDVLPGENLAFGINVTHMLPQYFPEPLVFDEQRWLNGGARPAYVYTPFGLGPHTCLGAGLAESLTVWLVATLLRALPCDLCQPIHSDSIPVAAAPTPFVDAAVQVVLRV